MPLSEILSPIYNFDSLSIKMLSSSVGMTLNSVANVNKDDLTEAKNSANMVIVAIF